LDRNWVQCLDQDLGWKSLVAVLDIKNLALLRSFVRMWNSEWSFWGLKLGNELGSSLGLRLGTEPGLFGMKLGIALGDPIGLKLGTELGTVLGTVFRPCYAVGSEIGPKLRAVLGSELGAVLGSRFRMKATGCSTWHKNLALLGSFVRIWNSECIFEGSS
jgi:hypothetical protein